MQGWDAESFGRLNAAEYDVRSNPGTTDEAVDLIAAQACGGKVLEFAIGTGRIAVPLAARGIEVHGVEVSPDMVTKMRDKPGGDLPVTIGDMTTTRVDGEFDLVILVFNTLFNLTTQEAQVTCFRNAAAHLKAGGRFLIDAFVPDPGRFRDGQDVRVRSLDMAHLALDTCVHDGATQLLRHQRLWVQDGKMELVPLVLRYAWPSELDLMAELAGLRLVSRHGGWRGERFDGSSKMHVSIWEKL